MNRKLFNYLFGFCYLDNSLFNYTKEPNYLCWAVNYLYSNLINLVTACLELTIGLSGLIIYRAGCSLVIIFVCDVVPSTSLESTRASHTRVSFAPNNHSLPPPFLCCPTKNLRYGQRQPTRGFLPGTAVVPALPPPLPSSSRAVANAATERACLLRSAKLARS